VTIGVVVIGLGQIAIGYDHNSSQKVLEKFDSLSTAFSHNPKFQLIAGVDPDESARKRFMQALNIPTFSSIDKIPTELIGMSTAFVISGPTQEHLSILHSIVKIKKNPWILCEKPMGGSLFDVNAFEQVMDTSRILVNYSRRFSGDIEECGNEFKSIMKQEVNSIPLVKCEVYGGDLRTGSHFIDLCSHWFGMNHRRVERQSFIKSSADGPVLSFDTADVLYVDVDSGSEESYASLTYENRENLVSLVRGELTVMNSLGKKIMNVVVDQADTVAAFFEMIDSSGRKNRCTFQDSKRVHQIIDSLQSFK
jgi:Oxidoreductase family, NAD-binding Rossmann fold